MAYDLTNGIYKCTAGCVPAISVKADGKDQPIAGDPYRDTVAVKVVDAHTIEVIDRKGDRNSTSTQTVSADGTHMTLKYSGHLMGDQAQTGTVQFVHVTKGAAGSHAISGSWKVEKQEDLSSPGWDTVSVKRISANVIEETDLKAGKVIWVGRYSVSVDGKTLTMDWSNKQSGASGVAVSDKQ
jgi:hypothetical protein